MSSRGVLWIIWGAMFGSILIYAAVALFIADHGPRPASSSGVDLWLAFEAAGTFWAALVIRKMRLIDPMRSGGLDPDSPGGIAAIRKISIVCWALAESIGIFGLVVAFERRTVFPALAFIGASLVLELLLVPTISRTVPLSEAR